MDGISDNFQCCKTIEYYLTSADLDILFFCGWYKQVKLIERG